MKPKKPSVARPVPAQLHINKPPEQLFRRIRGFNEKERRSDRAVIVMLLQAAISQFDHSGCKSLTEFLEQCGVEESTAA